MHPRSALDLIGNTPLIELSGISPTNVRIFGKLEWCNPGGSIKDRPARQMILDAIEAGKLKPGMAVLEATSGNMGTALAFITKFFRIPCTLVVPEVTSLRKREDMERFGAVVKAVPGDTTEIALEVAYQMVKQNPGRYFMTDQYTNQSNVKAHYLTTGPEILTQCPEVTHVVAAQGSFGTLGGVGKYLKEVCPEIEIHAVVARPGSKTIFGIKEADKVMPLVDDSILSGRLLVNAHDSYKGIEIACTFGFLLGPSAGAVLAAALRLSQRVKKANIVCVFADSGHKYPGCPLYDAGTLNRPSTDDADHIAFTNW